MSITPFRVDVDDATLTDLRARLTNTRFAAATGSGWTSGADPQYLKDLASHWLKDFDWRAREARLNEFPQFLADVNGSEIHFVHIRAPRREGEPDRKSVV